MIARWICGLTVISTLLTADILAKDQPNILVGAARMDATPTEPVVLAGYGSGSPLIFEVVCLQGRYLPTIPAQYLSGRHSSGRQASVGYVAAGWLTRTRFKSTTRNITARSDYFRRCFRAVLGRVPSCLTSACSPPRRMHHTQTRLDGVADGLIPSSCCGSSA